MAIILHLRPVGKTRVLDPGVNPPCPLPPEGKAVEDAPFWRRRMKAKEVEKTTPALIAAGKAAREAREELEAAKAALAEQQEQAAQEARELEAKAALEIKAAQKAEQEARDELAALRAEAVPPAPEGGTGPTSGKTNKPGKE